MRALQVPTVLVLLICSPLLVGVADDRGSPDDDANLYDWLVSEEVPTSKILLAEPDPAAVSTSKIQDQGRYKVGVSVPVGAKIAPGRHALAGGAPSEIVQGALRLRSDGFVWSAVVESPGAASLRLGFDDFDLGEGVKLYLYSDGGKVDGPYTGMGPRGRGSFFTRTLPTNRLHLQLRYDGTHIAATLAATSFTLAEVAHLDERFRIGAAGTPAIEEHCANLNATCVENAECNLQDPSADPVVDALRNATGEMLFQSGGYWYLCTGTLIESLDGTPGYFWTSHTCISTSAEAASLETYFHFTTPCPPGGGATTTCDYADASNSDTPSVFGATIIDTSDVTDFTLLHLDGVLPAGTFPLPFSTAPVANTNGILLYRISHPSGAPQAFSEHVIDASYSLCGAPGNFMYSTDVLGATEGGSSGAAAVNENGEIVGQLYGMCGQNLNDVCDSVNNRTYDGAFAATWQNRSLVRHALAQEPLPVVSILAEYDLPSLSALEEWTTSFDNDGTHDNLSFVLAGRDGDGDLYVKFGSPPTISDWDCRPALVGTNETCTFDPAVQGTYYVMVRAYRAFSNATLTVTTLCYDSDGDGVCDYADVCFGNDASGDADADGVCADVDCDDQDPGAIAPPVEIDGFLAKTVTGVIRFSWNGQSSSAGPGTVYDVFAGLLSDLRGSKDYSSGFCAEDNLGTATYDAAGLDPSPGEGFYFLVRGQNGCPSGTGTFGNANRDSTAALSLQPCD